MACRLARRTTCNLLAIWLATAVAPAAERVPDRLMIEPAGTVLDGRRATAQLVATGHVGDGAVRDLTQEVRWTSSNPAIVTVSQDGRIEPRGNGQAEVLVRVGSRKPRRSFKSATSRRRILSNSHTRYCPR